MSIQIAAEMVPYNIGADASEIIVQLIPLLTAQGSSNEKLLEVARRIAVREDYETVDFMVLEGADLMEVRHHSVTFVAGQGAGAWEDSVQSKDAFTAFAKLGSGQPAVIYNQVQTDADLTVSERQMARLYGLGSVLVVPLMWDDEIRGAIAVGSLAKDAFGERDTRFLCAVANQVSALIRQQAMIDDLALAGKRIAQLLDDTVMLLGLVAEAHDQTTGVHLRGLRFMTELLASELGYSQAKAAEIGQAAVLHDIGKVRVPVSVLTKPGPLNAAERARMENHPIWGEALLSECPGFELAARISRSHHERWDGKGYPDGLQGEAIPLEVAIVTLADSYDAMLSARPYKAARAQELIMTEIGRCSGHQFSPQVVGALMSLYRRGVLIPLEQSIAA